MDLDDLKDKWQKLEVRADRLEEDNRRLAAELARGRVQSVKTKLVRHYRIAFYQCFMLPVFAPTLVVVLDFAPWVAWVYGIFGLVMAVLNGLFARSIEKTDIISLPVAEALKEAIRMRTRHRRLRTAGIIMCIVVISSMFGQVIGVDDGSFFFDGMVSGMIIGLVIGIPLGLVKEFRARRLIRRMREELEGCTQ